MPGNNDFGVNINLEAKAIVKNTGQIKELKALIASLQSDVDYYESALRGANDELDQMRERLERVKEAQGIDVLEEEVRKFQNTAEQSVREFSTFLKSVNLDSIDIKRLPEVQQIFTKLSDGVITSGQAIGQFKTKFRSLIDETYKQGGGIFDAQQVQTFTATLDNMSTKLDEVHQKIDGIIKNGVQTSGGGGGAANIADIFRQIAVNAEALSERAAGSIQTISDMVGVINQYANVDSGRLLATSNSLRAIAEIGTGSFSTKSVENIVSLAKQISELNQNGAFRFTFDVGGLKDVKISSTIHHITDLVTALKDADLSKLEILSRIDLSGWGNFKVNKESMDNLRELLSAVKVESEKAQQAVATATALGGERDALNTLTEAYKKHVSSVGGAVDAEKKKAAAAREVVAALKAENAASAQKKDTRAYKDMLGYAKQYKALNAELLKLDKNKDANQYQLIAGKMVEIQKNMAELAKTTTLTTDQARELYKVYDEIQLATQKASARGKDAEAAKAAAAAERAAAEQAKQAAKEKAAAEKEAAEAAKQAAKESATAAEKAAADTKNAANELKQKTALQKQLNTQIQQGTKLSQQFRLLGKNNGDLEAVRKAVAGMRELKAQLDAGKISTAAAAEKFRDLNLQLSNAGTNLKTAGGLLQRYWSNGLAQLGSRLAYTFSLVNIVMKATQEIKKMISTAVELDSALNTLQIVTRANGSEMDSYASRISSMAYETAQATKDLIDATTVYARLGYTMEESSVLAKYTAMLQGVGGIEASAAQDAITAVVKAFGKGVDDIEDIMDKMVIVGNNFPISVSQIAEGMNNASSMLAVAGNSLEESIALLTAANTTIQNISKASTGLRTIAARIRKTTTEEDGDEIVEEAKYQKMVNTLTQHHVSLVDQVTGEYRSTYDVIKDIAHVWEDMTSMEQAAVIEALAGTRQQNIFTSLVTQFQEAERAMESMGNASGELQESYDIYLDSIQAHINKLKAAFDKLSRDFVDSDFAKFVIDVVTKIIQGLDFLIDKLGVLGTVLGSAALIKGIKALHTLPFLEYTYFRNATLFATGTEAALGAGGALAGLSEFVTFLTTTLPILGAVAAAVTGIFVAVKLWDNAHPTLQRLTKDAENLKNEADEAAAKYDDLAKKIEDNNNRLEELQELKINGAITEEQKKELDRLQRENTYLEQQAELYRKIAQYKKGQAVSATNAAVNSFFISNAAREKSDMGLVDAAGMVYTERSTEGLGGVLNAIEDYKNAEDRIAAINEEMSRLDITDEKGVQRAAELQKELADAQAQAASANEAVLGFYNQLITWRESLVDADDEVSIQNLQMIDELLNQIERTTGRTTKSYDKFKSALSNLDPGILKKFIENQKLTEEEARKLEKWFRTLGLSASEAYGYFAQFVDELIESASATDNIDGITGKTIDELTSLRDELALTAQALEEYEKVMEGGEKDDAVKKMAEIYKGALEDINTGKIDSRRMHAAASLFMSPEQLAAIGYDMHSFAEMLRSDMMKTLFDPDDKSGMDYGQRFAKYVQDNFVRSQGVWMEGNKFFYDSLSDVSKAFGMSEAACAAFLSSLDMYGVQVMMSTEETTELARRFNEVEVSAKHAGESFAQVRQFIRTLKSEGRDQFEISSILQNFQKQGLIDLDTKTIDKTIAEVWQEIDEIDKGEAEASVGADIDPAMANLRNLETYLNALCNHNWQILVNASARPIGEGQLLNVAGTDKTVHGYGRASGKKREDAGGKTLVNELGPELISDNGEAYIANGGKPGFTDLSKDAIVFPADETAEILGGKKQVRTGAKADGTRAGLRSRLLGGGRVGAAATGLLNSLKNIGNSLASAAKTIQKSATTTYVSTYTQPTGGNKSNATYLNTEGYNSSKNTPTTYQKTPTITVSQKLCPNCNNYVASSIKTCPHCGYRFDQSTNYNKTYTKTYTTKQNRDGSYVRTNYVTSATKYNQVKAPSTTGTYTYGQDSDMNPYGSGLGGNGGSGGGNNVGGADYGSQSDPQKVDWVAVKINRLQRAIADLEKVATSGFKKLGTRLDAAKKQISSVKDEIKLMDDAYTRYIKEADSVGLDAGIAKLVREGKVDITKYDDETRQKIDEYTEWYEKAIDCKSAIEELHQEVAQLYQDNFSNIQTDFENQLSQIEHDANMANKNLTMAQTKGYLENAVFYRQAADYEKQNIKTMKAELKDLNKAFKEAMASGEIEEGSESWYEMKQAIQSVEESIADANVQLVQYQKTIRSLDWSYFDYAQERFSQLTQEANFLIDLMSNDKLFKDNGQMTKRGNATVGMRALNYDAYMTAADAYRDEIKKINRQLASDPNDKELIARKEQMIQLQQQSIQSAEQEKNAMKDLVAEGIRLELESLRELIDAYKDSLDSAKSLYDYQKKVSEKTADIASLQKQLAAYTNDDSEETRARVQKLNTQLEKAQTELRETEWDQNISEQKKMLDELYQDYDETLNKRLDNVDQLMREMIQTANDNAGQIRSTIGTVSKEVGYSVTESMAQALGGSYANYMKGFEGVATSNQILGSINEKVAAMANASLGVKAYAKGGLIDYTGLAAVHGSPGNPEMVLSAADTEKFLQAAALMRNGLSIQDLSEQFAKVHGIFESFGGNGGGIGTVNITIPIERVQDYNDMVRQMQNDPKFEKLIHAMTLDRAIGGSKLKKNLVNF